LHLIAISAILILKLIFQHPKAQSCGMLLQPQEFWLRPIESSTVRLDGQLYILLKNELNLQIFNRMFSCVSILTLDHSFSRNQNSCGFCNFRPTPPVTLKKSYWRRELLDWGISKTEILSSMLLVRQMPDLNAVKQTNKSGCTKMTHTRLEIGKQISHQQPLVSVYWDYQNTPNKNLANNLLLFADLLGYVVNIKVYDNWKKDNKVDQKRKRTLVHLGWECVNVSQTIPNAADFSLLFDCSGEAAISPYSHTFIIVSGDGYSEILIPKLQDKGKKVIILARRDSENKNLESLANEFYFLDKLQNLIEAYKQVA
jgi:hypothetical protein